MGTGPPATRAAAASTSAAMLLALRAMGVVRGTKGERTVADAQHAWHRVDRPHERLQRRHDLGRPHRSRTVDRRAGIGARGRDRVGRDRVGCRRFDASARLGRRVDGRGSGRIGHLGAGRRCGRATGGAAALAGVGRGAASVASRRARPPSCTLPVAGSTGGGAAARGRRAPARPTARDDRDGPSTRRRRWRPPDA